MKGLTLYGKLTTTQASFLPEKITEVQERSYQIQATDAAVTVNLLDHHAKPVASFHLEIDGDGITPVVRLWDGENGVEGEPVYTRYLLLPGPA